MASEPGDEARIIAVGEGLWVRQAVDNMAWADMGEWGLAVDALEQPELEAEVFEAIAATLGSKPVRYILNTHTHPDHIALNAAFRRRGSEVVNQHTSPAGSEGRWFEGGRMRALMLPLGGCHTAEDCVVWLPEARALFVGDLFGWGLIPCGRLDSAMASRLLTTYVRMIGFGAATIIPGHGPLCTTVELLRWAEYFRWLVARIARACASGASDAQIVEEVAPPSDMAGWWRFLAWKHADSVGKVAQAVRAGRLNSDFS